MNKRNKLLEAFEGFTKDNMEYLVNNKKTYIRKSYRDVTPIRKIQNIIKNYDISKFNFVDKGYGIMIYPDKEFIDIVSKLDTNFDKDSFFYITLTENLNYIDFIEGIPPYLRGLSLSYKFYKMIINKYDFICSDRYSTLSAWNLWYNLLQDNDLYAITSNLRSCLINKNISDDKLIEIVNKVLSESDDFELSDDLKDKLDSLN